jgi:hypothetical protein
MQLGGKLRQKQQHAKSIHENLNGRRRIEELVPSF